MSLERAPLRFGLPLLAVVALGAVLRFPFLGYGLPGTPYVDAFRFVDEAYSLVHSEGPWAPGDYLYPGLLKLVLAAIYGGFGIESRTVLHLVPRALAAVADLGTIALVFALARRMTTTYGATLAAALHAVSIIAVTSARTEAADAALTLLLTAALVTITAPRLRPRSFVVAGLLVGLATGTKFSGAYGAIFLPAAAWLACRQGTSARRAAGSAAAGLALAAVAFLAVTPWFLPELAVYAKAFRIQADVQRYGQIGHVQSSALDYLVSTTVTWEQPWLSTSLLGNLGPAALLASLASLAAALAGKLRPPSRLAAIYVALYYVLVAGAGHVKAIRYLLPVLPALAAVTGAGVAELAAAFPRRRAVLEVLAAVLLLAPPLARTLPHLSAAARPMTNDLALAWAREHLPRGATVLLSPFYLKNLGQLDIQVKSLAGAVERQYRLDNAAGLDAEARPIFRPELVPSMRRSGIEYVVLGSYFEGSVYDTEENRRWFPKSVAGYAAFRAALAAEADHLYHVDGHAAGRLGPDIDVYRLRER